MLKRSVGQDGWDAVVRIIGLVVMRSMCAHCSSCAVQPAADGDNLVDSGTPSNMFPTRDRVRFPFRCTQLLAADACHSCRVLMQAPHASPLFTT